MLIPYGILQNANAANGHRMIFGVQHSGADPDIGHVTVVKMRGFSEHMRMADPCSICDGIPEVFKPDRFGRRRGKEASAVRKRKMMKCNTSGQNPRPLMDFQSVPTIREPPFDYVFMDPLLQINPVTGDTVQYDFNVILAIGTLCCHGDGRTPESKMNSTVNPSAFRIPFLSQIKSPHQPGVLGKVKIQSNSSHQILHRLSHFHNALHK
ncbi:hypothetical protein D3C75_825920 [compost metagenome]